MSKTVLDAVKQLIMFGDSYAHEFEDFPEFWTHELYKHKAKLQLDWRDEADHSVQMVGQFGVRLS